MRFKASNIIFKGAEDSSIALFYNFVLHYYSLCAVNFNKQKNKANAKKSPLPKGMEKMFC